MISMINVASVSSKTVSDHWPHGCHDSISIYSGRYRKGSGTLGLRAFVYVARAVAMSLVWANSSITLFSMHIVDIFHTVRSYSRSICLTSQLSDFD
jgi:hypothetical protein